MSVSHFWSAITVCALVLLTVNPASAKDKPLVQDGQGMDAHLFHTAVDNKGYFSQDGTQMIPHKKFSLGLLLDFGFQGNPAVEADKALQKKVLVENYINAVLLFNFGLWDMVSFGAQIPLVIPSGQALDYTVDPNEEKGWSTKGGIGDIAVHAKLRWIRADRHKVGLGTVIQYQTPIGKEEFLMGEPGGGAVTAKMIVDMEPYSFFKAALNVGVRVPLGGFGGNYLNEHFAGDGVDDVLLFNYGPMLTFGIAQSLSFWPGVMDFVAELYGSQMVTEMNAKYLSTEINLGIKLFVERNSYLMAGYAHGLPTSAGATESHYGFQSVENRFFIGFAFEPSIGDADADGIKDDLDQCPDDPEDRDDFEDLDGCPDPDNDKDGLPDMKDECPLAPEDKDGDQDDDGCPERGAGDRDGDGLLDENDECPDEPEDLDQFEDENGCPDNDNDADNILDIKDSCPNDPEDIDGFEDENGCPDPDNDQDRIPDVKDSCPNEPEVYNGVQDKDGCPDEGLVVFEGDKIIIKEKVQFDYDSAVIKEVSFDLLDAVSLTIINSPQIDKVLIQGHADERGDEKRNLALTKDRAASVMKYLLKKGVKSKKLTSQGYGEYCPIDKASNEAAWETNRRVEFKVLSIDDVPTNVETSCPAAQAKGIK